jgi:hypothetical protein
MIPQRTSHGNSRRTQYSNYGASGNTNDGSQNTTMFGTSGESERRHHDGDSRCPDGTGDNVADPAAHALLQVFRTGFGENCIQLVPRLLALSRDVFGRLWSSRSHGEGNKQEAKVEYTLVETTMCVCCGVDGIFSWLDCERTKDSAKED